MENMVKHLDLALSLYEDDGSGALKESKNDRSKRTFDEYNAFASYAIFITRHYFGVDGGDRNKDGLIKL
jgi:hypothetical protein